MSVIGAILWGAVKLAIAFALQVGILAIFAKSVKLAREKSGVELFMDCIPNMEKFSIRGLVKWVLELVLFLAPALIMHMVIYGLKFIAITFVRLMDSTIIDKAVKVNVDKAEGKED